MQSERAIAVTVVSTVANFFLFFSIPLSADEASADVYESLSDVKVGRLFFSVRERRQLDALRDGRALQKAPLIAARGQKTSDSAAGYISSRSGKFRVFRDGDFRPGAVNGNMRFPGDVEIVISTPVGDSTTTLERQPDDDEVR